MTSPLVVDSRRLARQPGASLRIEAEVVPDADIGNDFLRVDQEPVMVDLLLESVLDGILVTGSASPATSGTCVRCLEDLDRPMDVSFRQFFTYPEVESVDGGDEDEDITPMTGPLLDLRPAFRDATLLALPLSPTCRSDCPGLCPTCGFRMADDPEHGHERIDPRLAALADLRDELNSEGE